MARQPLAVWLYGLQIARLERVRAGLRLTYTSEALDRFPLHTPLLSVAMPLSAAPYGGRTTLPFFDGLLPEGVSRQTIAYDFGVAVEDTLGLLEKIGRECAGALVIQPATDPAPSAGPFEAEPLSDSRVGELIRQLRSQPLGVSDAVRLSLAGMQEKLLLARLPSGQWALPVRGMPSTHILKPEPAFLPNAVANEAFSLRLAKHLGLRAPALSVTEFSGRKVLVIERFDRRVAADGGVERIHQEDLCQALGVSSRRKYQQHGGPSLRQVGVLLRRWTGASRGLGELDGLLRNVTLDVVVGNADAHGKNLGLLHHIPGEVELAPVYDVMTTSYYPDVDQTLGMFVGHARQLREVTMDELVTEGVSWGLAERRARDVVGDLLDQLPSAVEWAARETPGVPDAVVERVVAQRLVAK